MVLPVAAAASGAVAVERGRCSINRASSQDLGTEGWVAMEIDLNQITRGSVLTARAYVAAAWSRKSGSRLLCTDIWPKRGEARREAAGGPAYEKDTEICYYGN